jgi:hypothetical protein
MSEGSSLGHNIGTCFIVLEATCEAAQGSFVGTQPVAVLELTVQPKVACWYIARCCAVFVS